MSHRPTLSHAPAAMYASAAMYGRAFGTFPPHGEIINYHTSDMRIDNHCFFATETLRTTNMPKACPYMVA